MLRLPPLRYASPTTLTEAHALLQEEGAVIAAGGTDLIPNLKRRQHPAGLIVSLRRLEGMVGVSLEEDGTVRIGASTTLAAVAGDQRLPLALRTAAGSVASPQVRNRATVGGNLCVDTRCDWLNIPDTWRQAAEPCLKAGGDMCWVAPAKKICWAVSSTDLAPVMIVLGARVRLLSPQGERTVSAGELYRVDGLDHLAKARDEILTEVVVPADPEMRVHYAKLRRRGSIDFPILGVAGAIRLDRAGTCTEARIVLGAVASAPLRATESEQALVGRLFGPEAITDAAEAARLLARPLQNTDLTSRYRKRMVPVFVRRVLEQLVRADPS